MVDYSVYLVTDSTPAILGPGRSVVDVVEAALRDSPRGTIGIVQLRVKNADARDLLALLRRLHPLTAAAGIPLVINDRVDVAAAAAATHDCEGVHLGQDDIDVPTARRLLGPGAIIGATASTCAEAVAACRLGADYVGLGTVFATSTKTDTKHVVGPAGVQGMLAAMAAAGHGDVPAVCIGGINASNARRVMFQSGLAERERSEKSERREKIERSEDSEDSDKTKELDGVAVVSAIMSAADPGAAAVKLAAEVRLARTAGPTDFFRPPPPAPAPFTTTLLPSIFAALQATTPLSHNMTNLVVQNFAANVALAVGASPIMSSSGAEAGDLARIPGSALVVNMGTATPESLANYSAAIAAYNSAGRPVIFDPVGAGATAVRRDATLTLLRAGYIDVIKGNEGEIQTVYAVEQLDTSDSPSSPSQQRGVDGSNRLDAAARADLVRKVAVRRRCVVVLTGAVDYVCDGRDGVGARAAAVAHGHPLLGQVTGTGCTLGTVLSATVSAVGAVTGTDRLPGDTFAGVVAGLVLYERAAELAAANPAVQGPGSFVPAFLDTLASCRKLGAEHDLSWLDELRVTPIL